MSIQGSVDLITTQGAVGWIFSHDSDGPILVQARLQGRIAAAATPAELLEPLRDVIAEGVVTLGSMAPWGHAASTEVPAASILPGGRPLDPGANEAASALLEALPDLLFQPAPLALLRALLDDNPVVSRAVLIRGGDGRFDQPSTAEDLPSPAECVLAVVPLGAAAGCTLDIMRGSHMLPEFNEAGQSRWTTPGATGDLAIARGGGSVDSLPIGPSEIAFISAGTLCRCAAC